MATFDEMFQELLKEEGGLVDDPRDSGGLTKYGISQTAYPNLDIENLTEDEAKAIYKKDYWNKMKLDKVPEHLRRSLFFAGVNMGIRNPLNKALQRIVGATDDGLIGPATVSKLKAYEGADSINEMTLKEAAIDYYAELADKRPKDRAYINGWLNRLMPGEERPFGAGKTDLRQASVDEIKQRARSFLNQQPSSPASSATPAPEPETPVLDNFSNDIMAFIRDELAIVEGGESPATPDLDALENKLGSFIQEQMNVAPRAPQEVSDPNPAPVKADEEVRLPQSEESATPEWSDAELELINAATGVETPASTEEEEVVEEGVATIESDKWSDDELDLIRRATGTVETEDPVVVASEGEGDDSKDPIYGIF